MTRALVVLLGCCSFGCAAQLTTSVERAAGETTLGMTGAGSLHALRESNSVVGVRVHGVVDDGLALRSTVVHGGYDWRALPGYLTLEPGFDLGFGQPSHAPFEGVGAYWGLAGTARLRIYPWGDEPAYNLAYPMVELVVLPRGGMWMPPEHSNTTSPFFEVGAELGLRFAIGSDIAAGPQGRVWDGGPSCDPRAGGQSCHEENP